VPVQVQGVQVQAPPPQQEWAPQLQGMVLAQVKIQAPEQVLRAQQMSGSWQVSGPSLPPLVLSLVQKAWGLVLVPGRDDRR